MSIHVQLKVCSQLQPQERRHLLRVVEEMLSHVKMFVQGFLQLVASCGL